MNGGRVQAGPRPLEDGLAAFAAGDYATAERLLLETLPVHADDPAVATALGLIALDAGRFADATTHLTTARRRLPRDTRLLYALAECHLGLGDTQQAALGYQATLKLDPAYRHAQRRLGQALIQLGRTAEAMTALNQAVYADRTDIEARLALASLSVTLGDDRRAAAQLHMVDRLAPHRLDVRTLLADIHFRAGDFRQMAAELEALVVGGVAEFATFWRLGGAYSLVGRNDDALAMYQQAAMLESTPGEAHLAAAQVAEAGGRHRVALETWRVLAGVRAYQSEAQYAVARIRVALGGPTGLTGYLQAA